MDETTSDAVRADHHPHHARLGTVDVWRGFILCTIFVNHIPGNPFERLTYRNYGFSDSAEAFVFISGLSLALAYGRRFAEGGARQGVVSLLRRAWKIYAVHLLLSAAGVAIFAVGAAIFVNADLMQPHGRDLVLHHPREAVLGVVSLGHQFGYFNILPLYVLLVAMAPLLLVLSRFGVATMLGVSAAIYVATRLTGFNIPTWPMQGTWFFDPFAWQLLMAIGIACGMGSIRRPNRWLTVLAGLVVLAAAFCATDGFGTQHGLFDAVRTEGDLDKTSLGLGRLVHFCALAYLVWSLRLADHRRASPLYRALGMLGRHGLAIFAVLSLLAAVGQAITQGLGHSLVLDTLVVGGGIVALYGCAWVIDGHHLRGVAAARFADQPWPTGAPSRTTL